MPAIELADVEAAARRLAGVANRTPVVTSRTLDALTGGTVFLKCESFQRAGAFKFRGAYNTLSQLGPDEQRQGVCTVSSGNHAQALALAARELGIPCAVLMPEDAPAAKVAATEGYGAEIVRWDRYATPAVEAGAAFAAARGVPLISAYDDPRISAGAGTAALELVDDAGPLDVLVAPVGGGGGMTGYATVVAARCPGAAIIGAEPAAAGKLGRSLAEGRNVTIEVPRTIADGLQVPALGALPYETLSRLLTAAVQVDEEALARAVAFLFQRCKLVVEPSGAIGVAALLSGAVDVRDRRVGVIVTGGNIDAARYGALLTA